MLGLSIGASSLSSACSSCVLPWCTLAWWLRVFFTPSFGQLKPLGVESLCDPALPDESVELWAPPQGLGAPNQDLAFAVQVPLTLAIKLNLTPAIKPTRFPDRQFGVGFYLHFSLLFDESKCEE